LKETSNQLNEAIKKYNKIMRWAVAVRWALTAIIWGVILIVPYSFFCNVKTVYEEWLILVGIGGLLGFVREILLHMAYLMNLRITHLKKKYD